MPLYFPVNPEDYRSDLEARWLKGTYERILAIMY